MTLHRKAAVRILGRVEMEVSSVEQGADGAVHLFGNNNFGLVSQGFALHPFAAVRKLGTTE